ncbi:MAG TPA: EAL domain-containing protein [Dongiaceae bacterium]|nr:EAL domain-containing protein [Dongiaceae bacterium]
MEISLAEIFPEEVTDGTNFAEAVERRLAEVPGQRVMAEPEPVCVPATGGHDAAKTPKAEPQFTPIHLKKDEKTGLSHFDLQRMLDMSERGIGSWQAEIARDRPGHAAGAPIDPMQRLNPIKLKVEGIGVTTAGVEVAGLRFTYSPIWSAAKKAVISHHLNMTMRDGAGRVIEPEDIFGGGEEVRLIRTIDRLVMKRGLADLARAFAANKKYIACIPVTSYSLLDRWGTPTIFDSLLQGLVNPLPKLIVLDVIDAQAMERLDLMRCAAAAKDKCKYLLLRASLDQTNFSAFAHPMVRGIGGSLRDHAWSEKDAAKKLDVFVAAASSAKLETFIFGIMSRSMAFAAIAAGFDYISGSAIAPDMDDASGVAPVDMLRLFG